MRVYLLVNFFTYTNKKRWSLAVLTQIYKGTNIYRISIYNREVRSALKSNVDHYLYSDRWALAQGQDVSAISKDDALKQIEKRYPKLSGFVVESLKQVN